MIMWLHKLFCRKGGWLRGIWHQFWIRSVFIAHNHTLFFTLSFLLCQQKVLDDVFLLSPPQKMQQRLTPHSHGRGPTLYCLFSVDWLLLLVQLVCGRWDWRRENPFWVTQRSSKTGVQDIRWTLPRLRLLTSVVVVSCTENSKVPYDILIWYFLYCVEVYAVFMNHDPYSQPNNTKYECRYNTIVFI